ncbi:hypothetical protein FDP41_007829 [Naegleria fowleri]|uniref:ornithine decarboxylase n=1 Tax=Naegleria fowleri TaxID=5763 RepID=A0A6A5CBI8_NAEFO|nr:uncharacterized protein FDP41_007829 [Naegleria fowleri]KAF0983914.1 hypothetical protein FDP41_007829 [Naegleria fowleri]
METIIVNPTQNEFVDFNSVNNTEQELNTIILEKNEVLNRSSILPQTPAKEQKLEDVPVFGFNYDAMDKKAFFDQFGVEFIPSDLSTKKIIKHMYETKIRCGASGDDLPTIEEPFYIVDLSEVLRQVQTWRQELPRVTPFYAIKCNPNPYFLRVLEKLGCGFDVASRDEIECVKQVLPNNDELAQRCIYANPCHPISHVKYASTSGVQLTTADNVDELYKLKKYWPDAQIVIRIKTDDSHSVCQFSTKFGAELGVAFEMVDIIKDLGLNLVGVSFHVGSGCNDVNSFLKAIRDARAVFDYGFKVLNKKLWLLDLGGGWQGRSNEHGNAAFISVARTIKPLLDELFPVNSGVKIIAEPGRYIAHSTHTLVTSIFSRRIEKSRVLYYIYEGVYHSFNCLIFDHAEPEIKHISYEELISDNVKDEVEERVGHTDKPVTLYGSTCDSMDVILKDSHNIPNCLECGDVLFVELFGAYTIAAGTSFNGFKLAKIHYIARID